MLKLSVPRDFSVAELARETGLTESTVRYYLKEVLDKYMAKKSSGINVQSGKTKRYPAQVLERLLFIRYAKEKLETASGQRMEPTIAELKGWMANITDEQVHQVLTGDDTLEFGVTKVEGGVRIIETLEGEKLPEDSLKYGQPIAASFDALSRDDSAASYARENLSVYSEIAPLAAPLPTEWQTESFGKDLQIRYRKRLSRKQMKQLRAAGNLLRLILGEEET
jgi:predicted transcriptional regulator